MKRLFSLAILAVLLLAACGAAAEEFTDARGRVVRVESPERVVSLYASYADAWLQAGGTLLGAPADFFERFAGEGVVNLGGTKAPDAERMLLLDPDLVILSADIAGHIRIGDMLDEMGIPCAYFSTKDYRDYMRQMQLFCALTGRADCLEAQEEAVRKPVEAIIAAAQAREDYGRRTALLLRAYSSGVRAKGSGDTVAGVILRDMGFVNIADGDSLLSENLSLEAILMADPDYIFVTTMGESSSDALNALARVLTDDPAWAGLSAVKNGRLVTLEADLFHHHPNIRWTEAYESIANLLSEAGA